MSARNDGGPAFPTAPFPVREGMSMRDWFAGQALAGTLANSEGVHAQAEPTISVLSGDRRASFAEYLARQAYAIADAMLAARETQP